jgi:glycosyltransferase involved in cell wall biosynthesis
VAGACNTGLEEARGRYIARMDADDVSLPQRLEKQVRFMDEHPEVGVSGTWKEVIGEGQGKLWFPYPSDPEQIKVGLLFYCPVGSPVAIMRRALLEKHRLYYDEAVGFIEDWDMWERAAVCFPLSNLTEVLLYYRIHGANVSIVRPEETWASEWMIKARQIERLGLFPTDEEKEVHDRVFFGPYEGPGFAHRAEAWLFKLARANRRKRVYRIRSFEREMRRLYFNACIRNRGLRPVVVLSLFLSRLCLFFPPSPGELIGLGSRYFRSLAKAAVS